MITPSNEKTVPPRILLVEDNKADIRLTEEAFKESEFNIHLDVVTDGEQALDFLYKRNDYAKANRPNVILLDLDLPKKSGLDVLTDVKANDTLKKIPVVVLTTSDAFSDISKSYAL